MEIVYKLNVTPLARQVIELYENAGLPRPTDDEERIKKMLEHSDVIVTAWHNDLLVGVSRAITDWVWCCYLSDLAVRKDYSNAGIGRKLVELTKEKVGEQSMVLLLSVPEAMEYYPKIGFVRQENSFLKSRTR